MCTVKEGNVMSTKLVNSASIIAFPRPCALCESAKNVQLFAGLLVCESCQKNIRITNPDISTSTD